VAGGSITASRRPEEVKDRALLLREEIDCLIMLTLKQAPILICWPWDLQSLSLSSHFRIRSREYPIDLGVRRHCCHENVS
jgi:hypothetical protein